MLRSRRPGYVLGDFGDSIGKKGAWTRIVAFRTSRKGTGQDAPATRTLWVLGEAISVAMSIAILVLLVCVCVVCLGSEFSFGLSPLTGCVPHPKTQFFLLYSGNNKCSGCEECIWSAYTASGICREISLQMLFFWLLASTPLTLSGKNNSQGISKQWCTLGVSKYLNWVISF